MLGHNRKQLYALSAFARCLKCGAFYDPELGHNPGVCRIVAEVKAAQEARGGACRTKTFLACGCELVNRSASVKSKVTIFNGEGKAREVTVYYCTTGKHKGFVPIAWVEIDGQFFVCNTTRYILERTRETGHDIGGGYTL